MDIGNWITIGMLGTTLLLAIAAFWAIWQNYAFRRKGYQNRLLDEIIEWAEDICRCSFGGEIKQETLVLENQLLNYQELYIISEYIEKIAGKFGGDLYPTVLNITTPLANVIETIQEYLKNPQDEHIDARLEGYEEMLLKRARILIEEATTIKAKDIS